MSAFLSNIKSEAVYSRLDEEISCGRFHSADGRLPTERELAEHFNVARNTLRQALQRLERENKICRIRNRGTYVKSHDLPVSGRIIVLENIPNCDISVSMNYILPGLQNGCRRRNLALELVAADFLQGGRFIDMVRCFRRSRSVVGFVTFGGLFSGNEEYIRLLQAIDYPVVMSNCFPADHASTGFTGLYTDQKAAWEEAVLELKKSGHRRIAFIGPQHVRGYLHNIDGWLDFLRRQQLYRDGYGYYHSAGMSIDSAVEAALDQFSGLPQFPQAILCYSDFYCIPLLHLLKKRNIPVPEKVSVMGCCGYPGGDYLDPSLSTVDFDYFGMGEKAIELLVEQYCRKGTAKNMIHPHRLILKESTATEKGTATALTSLRKSHTPAMK